MLIPRVKTEFVCLSDEELMKVYEGCLRSKVGYNDSIEYLNNIYDKYLLDRNYHCVTFGKKVSIIKEIVEEEVTKRVYYKYRHEK